MTLLWLEQTLEYFDLIREREKLAVRLAEQEKAMTVEDLLKRQDKRIARREEMRKEAEEAEEGRMDVDVHGDKMQYVPTPQQQRAALQAYGDLALDDDDDEVVERMPNRRNPAVPNKQTTIVNENNSYGHCGTQ